MRIVHCILALCLLLVAALPASAQDADKDAALLAQLTQMEKDSWEAVMKGDRKFFDSYLAQDSMWVLADGTMVDRESYMKGLSNIQVKKYTMGPTSLRRITDDVALILYRVSYEAIQDGHKELFSDIESSSLYVRREGKWQESFYQETPVHGASHGTAHEAKQMVARAIERFQKDGPAAFETITKGVDGFRDRDLYVFVAESGKEGKVVAYGGSRQPVNPIGKRLVDVKSPDGDPIGEMVLNTATEQGAWIDYSYVDPVTNKVEHKFSWVVRFDKHIFGCGIYVPAR